MTGQRGRVPFWARLDLHLPERHAVASYRDWVWGALEPPDAYEKAEPHVTLHPGFTAKPDTASDAMRKAASLLPPKVEVLGLKAWPSEEEPAVVMLELEPFAGPARRALQDAVAPEGTVDREPVPEHITLFKAGDAGEDWSVSRSDADLSLAPEPPESVSTVRLAGWSLQRRG